VLVLQQIWARLACETVFVGRSGGIGQHLMTMPVTLVGSASEPPRNH
jgi:hypothetical protein